MDLFGRELILPRSTARRLHLTGMSATAIAERLEAPFDVVAQQLLDALLLPQLEPDTSFANEPPTHPLNEEQAAAASHRGAPFILEAGPGTGKTQTLVGRVVSLIDSGVDPREILVLTFSNKAAGEMSDRIATVRPEAAAAMWIGTFHAFGLDFVKTHHAALGFEREPRLMDRSEAISLLEEEYLSLRLVHHEDLWNPARPLREMLQAISRAKDEVADHRRYAALAQAMIDAAKDEKALEAAERCAEVALVYERYEEVKSSEGAIDYGDLVSLPVTLLEGHPDIAARQRARFKHVLVDEYQDVNRSSVRLLKCITEEGRGLWVVGDARQAIYRFRGASSLNMARFKTHDFPTAASGRLRVNYRSTPEIVGAFSTFGATMTAGGATADLAAHRNSSGSPPEHVAFGNGDDEADALANEIHACEPHAGYRGQAVLCAGNERLGRLGQELERRGVPVLYLGNLFERAEVKDLLTLLTLLVDRRAAGLVRRPTLDGLAMGLELPDAVTVLADLRLRDAKALAWRDEEAPGAVTSGGREALRRLSALLAGFKQDDAPWQVLARIILDRSSVAASLATATDVPTRAQGIAVWQLMNFLRATPRGKGTPIQRTLDAIRRLIQLADERDLRQLPLAAQGIDGVRLMTIHGSKGLEFPVVHLMGQNKGTMPAANRRPVCPVPDGIIEGAGGGTLAAISADHVQEQECLFYVAASRARDRLMLFSATRDSAGRRRNPSDFIARMGRVPSRTATPQAMGPRDPDLQPLPVNFVPPIELSTVQLQLYDRCPRRFLYSHVLGAGGLRTPTTLSRMHEVIQQVVNDIADLQPESVTAATAREMLNTRWREGPLVDAPYDQYLAVAQRIIDKFIETRTDAERFEVGQFIANVGNGRINAIPTELLSRAGGSSVARIVRTGHAAKTSGKHAADAAFAMAIRSTLPDCGVEMIHLADDDPVRTISFSEKESIKHLATVDDAINAIGSGRFVPHRSERTCPSCPMLFICGPVAEGELEK